MEQQRVHDRTDELDDRDPRDERDLRDEREDERDDLGREVEGTEEGTFDRADGDQRARMDDEETGDEVEAAETRAEVGREEAADEQLTVPEDRDAAAAAAGRTTSTTPDATTTAPAAPMGTGETFELFEGTDRDDYRRRWETVQASFVDDPRGAATQADGLLGEVVEHVARRRQQLHDELDNANGGDDTEAMRLALRRYRDLFHALMGG